MSSEEPNINENDYEDMMRPLASIAVAWHWPWTVRYHLDKKLRFYYNEELGRYQTNCPADLDLNMASNGQNEIQSGHRRFNFELMQRRRRKSKPSKCIQDSLDTHEIKNGDYMKSLHAYFEEENALQRSCPQSLSSVNSPPSISKSSQTLHSQYEAVTRLPPPARLPSSCALSWQDRLADASNILSRVKSVSSYSSSSSPPHTSPSLPTCVATTTEASSLSHIVRPSTAPCGRSQKLSPLKAKVHYHHHPGIVKVYPQLLSMLEYLWGSEDSKLRKLILEKHLLGCFAMQKQLILSNVSLTASPDVHTIKAVDTIQHVSPSRRSATIAGGGHKDTSLFTIDSALSLAEFVTLHTPNKQETIPYFLFEKEMTTEIFRKYSHSLNVLRENPLDLSRWLLLIDFLLRSNSNLAAMSCLEHCYSQISTFYLSRQEFALFKILHIRCRSRFLNKYPSRKGILELGSQFPEDATLLAFVAKELRDLSFSYDSECYFIASLAREPLNTVALRGYGLLCAHRADYSSAINYLTRVPLSANNGLVTRLEAAWCCELLAYKSSEDAAIPMYATITQYDHAKIDMSIVSLAYSCSAYIHFHQGRALKGQQSLFKALSSSRDVNAHALCMSACCPSLVVSQPSKVKTNLHLAVDILTASSSCSLWLAELGLANFYASQRDCSKFTDIYYRRSISRRVSMLPLLAYMEYLPHSQKSHESQCSIVKWALTILTSLPKSMPHIAATYSAIAYVHLHVNMINEAESLVTKAVYAKYLNSGPSEASLLRCQASIALRLGQQGKAIELLQQSLERYPSNPPTLNLLSALYTSMGLYRNAYEIITKSTGLYAQDPFSWELRGILAYIVNESLEKVLESVEKSSLLRPSDRILRFKGQLLHEMGKLDEARDAFESIIARGNSKDGLTLVSLIAVLEALQENVNLLLLTDI